MSGQRNHDRPYYRCRYPLEYGISEEQHPRNVYVKESAIELGLDKWLASLFDDHHLEETCEILAGATQPDPQAEARRLALLEEIRDCDRRFEQYKAVLDEGADPKVVAQWMAEVNRERADLEAQLEHPVPGGKLERSQVKALVEALQDIVGVLADADRDDKAELYRELGVEMTYDPEGSVSVRMAPRGLKVRVGGATLRSPSHPERRRLSRPGGAGR